MKKIYLNRLTLLLASFVFGCTQTLLANSSDYGSQVTANADPTGAGTVYVQAPSGGTNGSKGSTSTGSKSESTDKGKTINHSYTLKAETNDGYTFSGWYDGSTRKTTNLNYTISVAAKEGGTSSYTRTAKWTAKTYTVTFDPNGDEHSAGSVETTSKTVTFADTYGTLPTPTRRFYAFGGWFTGATDGSQVTADTKVTTASDDTLFAHWTLAPEHQTVSWDEMPLTMTKEAKQPISLVSTSGLDEFIVTSANPDIIKVSEGYLVAGTTNGTVEITAIQPGNDYYYPDTLKTIFTVSSKETPSFFEKGFSEGVVNTLKVDSLVTLNVSGVSDGLNGDFTVTTAKGGSVMGVVRNGSAITFTALHAGKDTITVNQAGNDDIYAASRTYIFDVTRNVPQFTLSSNALELEETAVLTLKNVSGHTISFEPEGKVSYDGSTGVITAVSPGTTVLTVSQPQTNSIAAKTETFNITVSKKTPTLTVKMNGAARTSLSVAQGSVVDIAIEHTSDAEVVVTPVSGAQYASYVNGKMTAGAVGTATYRATLAETGTCQSVSVDFTLTVTAGSRHLEVNVTSETAYNNLKSGSNGDNAWKGNEGFCVGGYNGWLDGVADWNDKYVEFKFDGVPDKLTFDYKFIYRDNGLNKMTATAPGGSTVEGQLYFLYVDESADKQTWSAVWNDQVLNKDKYQSASVSLKKTTRYVRFHLHANYGALYKNIKITELKYLEDPEPASIDFGSAVINSGEVSQTSLINWCNVSPLSVTSSNPRFTVSPSQFGNFDTFGTQQLTISYTHTNEVGANEGDITISNATYTKTIHVSAETTKRPQTITWNSDLAATGYAMNVDEQYPDEIYVPVLATATNGKRITFTSDKPEIVEVVADTALLAKAVGTANITAYQAGDAEYQEVSDTKTFQVTNKQKQSILWDQNLYGLLTTSGSVELTATATSGGEITYTSGNTNVVTISGNILTVVGEGEATITATQEGFTDANEVEWLGVSQNNYVIVRNPASQCNGMALSQGSLTLNNNERVFDLSGIPATLTFTAKHGTKSALWGTAPSYAPLKVEQYANINNLWDWYEVYNKVVGSDNTSSGNIALDESAKKVRFSTIESGTDHTISNIRVTRKKFMRSDVNAINENVENNATWQQTITVSHSNIDVMTVTSKQGLLNLSASTLGAGCGSYGDDAFTASFTPTIKNHEYLDTIVITDNKQQPSTILIPVRLYSKGLNQSITGFDLPTAAVATDDISVSATASSGLDVSFESTADDIAYVANGKLVIQSAGTVTITAKQEGNATYDAAPSIAKSITISKASTSITTAPTATDITYGQTLAEATLTGGEGSVAGTFAWEAPETKPAAGTPSYNVVFTPTQDGIYATASTLISVNVAKATPVVTRWPDASNITIAQALSNSNLTNGEATVEGTFAWKNPDIKRQPAGEHDYPVVFTPTDPSYNTVEGVAHITIDNVLAKITSLPTAVVENPTFGMTLAEVALQGGSCNVEGAFAWADATTPLLAGTHNYTVTFTPTDLELYSAVNGEISLTAAKATPTVTTVPTASLLTYGAALSTSQLTEGAGSVEGTFAWKDGTQTFTVGEHAADVIFTPTDIDNYNTVETNVTVTVIKATPTIVTAVTATGLTYGQTLEASLLSGEASVNGTFAWNIDLTTKPNAGVTEYAVLFTPTDGANYNTFTTTATVSVSMAVPVITTTVTAADITYGQTLEAATLSGEANVPGTFVWDDKHIEPTAGTHEYEVFFMPEDDDNYESVSVMVGVNVAKATPLIETAPTAAAITYGQTLADATLSNGEADVNGTFAWADATVAPNVGENQPFAVIFTPEDADNYTTANTTALVTVAKAASELTVLPEAVAGLVYTGEAQTLIVAGEAQGGTVEYSLDGENFAAALPTGIDAGDYTVSYRVVGDANHSDIAAATVAASIAKADASAMAPEAVANLVYTGEPQTLIVAGAAQGGTIEYSLDGENFAAALPTGINAGDYTVSYRVVGDANHNDVAAAAISASIAKADASAVAPEAVANLVYTGEPQTLIVAGAAQGGTIEYSLDGENFAAALPTGINAGDYTVSFRVVGDANHNDVAAAAISASIAKAEAALTAPTIVADLVYTGAAQALVVAGEAEGGELLYSLDGETYAAALPMGTNAGAYTIYYKVVADANHSDIAAATLANSIAKADPAIVWPTAQNICVGNRLSAAVLLGGSADVDGAFAWENGDEAFAEIGTYHRTVAFTPADALNYNGATESIEVVVGKAQPAITAWPSANGITYGQTLAEAALNNDGAAAVPGTFAWKDETFVPAAGTQQCVVVFTPTDLENYGVVNGEVSVEVAKAEAALTAPTIVADLVYTGATQALVVAGEAQGGELLYSLDGENYAAALPMGTNAGAYTIYYKVAGDANHSDIAAATLANSIAKATPTILVKPTANGIRVGDALSASLLIGGEASTNGTFAWENGAFVAAEAGTHEYAVVFTPADADNFYTAAETVSVEVGKAQPAITAWPTATEITYGQLLSASSLENGAAAVEGTFAWADGSQELNAGAHTAIVVFTPTDLENYSAVNGEATVSVKKATPAINAAPTAAAITYGQTLADATLSNGEAGVNGTFAWADATVTPNVGEDQAFAVVFTPADADNYTTANTTALVTVGKADAAITVQPTVAPLTYGQTLADATLSYDAVAAGGTFAWAQATDEVLNAGEHQVAVLFTPADAANYNTAETTVTVTVNKAATTINVKPTATGIGYGQFLEASELVGGEATTEGTFAWANPTEMPDMGEGDFEVIFTPTDAANYLTATTTVHLVVAKGVPELYDEPTVSGNLVYGTMLADLTLVGGEAIVDGTFAWQNPTETLQAGMHEYNVVFTPDEVNQDEFDVLVFRITITAAKATPNVITWPTASAITYGQTLSEATLSTDGEADVDGTFVWQNGTSIPEQGVAECVLLFVPDNDNYKTVQQVVEVVVNAASITTGVDETEATDKAVKVLREDKLLIIRGGRTYTATGRLVE